MAEIGKKEREEGVIKGILLHKEESDRGDTNRPNNVKEVYLRLIGELNLKEEDVHLLVGEMLDKDSGGAAWEHNSIVDTLHDIIDNCYVIESFGLP